MTRKVRNLAQVIQMAEDVNGKIKFAPTGILGKLSKWTDAEGDEVAGDANANGTIIVSLSIPASSRFICTSLVASVNITSVVNIAYGLIAAHTDIYHVDIKNAGATILITEETPIFVYNNSTTAAVTLLMIAPLTAKGLATNNAVTKFFHGFMGGLVIPNA